MAKAINLLPDIKQERLRQKRNQQLTKGVAFLVMAVMATIAIVMALAVVWQKRSLASIQENIAAMEAEIAATEDLDKLLGMQVAMEKLPEINRQKLHVSELPGILEQVVPNGVRITSFEFSSDGTVEISGETGSYRSLYTFVDALENSTAGNDAEGVEPANLFSSVMLTGSTAGDSVGFSLTAVLNTSLIQPDGGGEVFDIGEDGIDG